MRTVEKCARRQHEPNLAMAAIVSDVCQPKNN